MSSSNTVQVTTISDESHYNEYLDKIRKEIRNAAENWFHIAYYVYEMKYFEYYKFKYDNIVDCCRAEFGFKKSTTYNFINIVEQFGCTGRMTINMQSHKFNRYVGYADFISQVRGWNYSQLVSMLSLSEKERASASPDMSSRQIKLLKTNSKRLENSSCDVVVEPVEYDPDQIYFPEAEIVPPVSPSEQVDKNPSPSAPSDEISELSKRLEKVQNDLDQTYDLFLSERESNHRINVKLVDMTMERDAALQQLEQLQEQIKKLKAENKKLKAEIKQLKTNN